MNAKLTLTMEQPIIEKAKRYAKSKGQSLSDIIENYLRLITKDQEDTDIEITPIVKSLRGTFKALPNFDYKKELTVRLSDRYL